MSAFADTPMSVPSVSKRSTKRNANTITMNSRTGTPFKLNLNMIGARLGIEIPFEKSGSRL